MRTVCVLAGASALVITSAARAQFLVVPDSTNDILVTFDPNDGSLINSNFADIGGLDDSSSTPKDAIQVGTEIWVSDQLRDTIYRFDTSGTYLSAVTGGMDNIRGMAYANGTVYVSNSGDGNGAPGESIVMFDAAGNNMGSFAGVGDPFDVLDKGDGLYIDDIDGDTISVFGYDGSFVETIVDSDGVDAIDFPQQLAWNGAGNILAAGFSSPSGIYEYAPDGTQLDYIALGGLRGVYELGNGNIMFTDGDGVHILDINSGGVSTVYDAGSMQYINLVVPAPAGVGLLGLAGIGALRRRR